MTKPKWTTSKKYPGVRCYQGQKGKVLYIAYSRAGKQILEKVGTEKEGYSLELAATIRGNRIRSIRHGEELPQDRKDVPTFGEVAKKFLEWAESHKKSFRDDESRYRHHLAPRFENVPVDQIGPLDLERLKKQMSELGRSPGTIQLTLALFRGIFNKGREWNLIRAVNPMGRVRMPKVDNSRERFLSKAEVELLLEKLAERSRQAYDLAVLALNTGARSGELLNLTWGDVNLDSGIIVFRNTKSGRTRRIPLNEEAFRVLTEREKGSPTSLVFLTSKGAPIREITNTFQKVADELFNKGIATNDRRNKVVFHTLRHTAASHLVMSGVPLATVKEILGHRSLSMVERYAHLTPEAQRDALQKLAYSEGSNFAELNEDKP